MENEVIDSSETVGLVSDSEIKGYLQETAKWARFIAIVGFIGIGLMAIAGLTFGTIMSKASAYGGNGMQQIPSGLFTAIYLVMAVLYFFPVFYMYNFAVKMRQGLLSNNDVLIRESFKNLKSHYKFIGVLLVVVLSIYGLLFVGGVLFGSLMG